MAHRVTVQPLTKKRKISWRLLKIENQFLPPIPFPPRSAGGRGTFFCGFLQAGVARLQKPNFFLPLPNGAYAVGEGAGGGAKATGHKGPSIAVWLPGARLNSYRTFSFLDSVCQHMASQKMGESAKKRKGELLTFARGHLDTFARSHFIISPIP